MISFRYHLVSIVAVFFALAIGLLMGTTVINQGVIARLNAETDAAAARSRNLREALDRTEEQLTDLQRFGDDVEAFFLDGQLLDRQIVLVTAQGVDAQQVGGVRTALERSGADITAVVIVSGRMALTDATAEEDLAELLEAPAGTPEDLTAAAGEALGARLAAGAEAFGPDPLQELVDAQFVTVEGTPEGGIAAVGGSDQSIVVLSGDDQEPVVDPEAFLVPLVRATVAGGEPVAAGETEETVYPFVPLLRADGALADRIVTVDNADTVPGRLAVVLGLRRLLETGEGGHYGVKDGAPSLLPPR